MDEIFSRQRKDLVGEFPWTRLRQRLIGWVDNGHGIHSADVPFPKIIDNNNNNNNNT